MNADGSGQTRLTNNQGFDWWLAWSPDGRKIAFQSDRDGNGEVYVMNADGSGQTNLTDNQAHDGMPAWSPNIQDSTTQPLRHHRDSYDLHSWAVLLVPLVSGGVGVRQLAVLDQLQDAGGASRRLLRGCRPVCRRTQW
jgi:dipeptidyl aminopeptidase/acylaminoacyl peptidase